MRRKKFVPPGTRTTAKRKRAGMPATRGAPAAMYANNMGRLRATEIKAVDLAETAQNIGTAGVFQAVNFPVSGAAFYQRVGNRIQMKSLHLNGNIVASGANGNALTMSYARIMVVYDRQCNGANPALADLLTSFTSAGGTASSVYDGINMQNRDRFLVLMDMKVNLPPIGVNGATAASTVFQSVDPNANAGDSNQGQLMVNRFIKLKGLETHFKGVAGNVADIATGSLLVFTISNDTNANPAYQFTYSTRLKFYD